MLLYWQMLFFLYVCMFMCAQESCRYSFKLYSDMIQNLFVLVSEG